MRPPSGKVIELGCGTGELARMIAPYAERVDSVDVSAPMLARARAMTASEALPIRWIHSSAEEVQLEGPYALAIAGDALHWMNWGVVLSRLHGALMPDAPLAIVSAVMVDRPWSAALLEIIPGYSVMKDFKQYVLVEELESRGLFKTAGTATVGPDPFQRTIDEYIVALHATSGLARDRMGEDSARAFDAEVGELVRPFAEDGLLRLEASATVAWGRPMS